MLMLRLAQRILVPRGGSTNVGGALQKNNFHTGYPRASGLLVIHLSNAKKRSANCQKLIKKGVDICCEMAYAMTKGLIQGHYGWFQRTLVNSFFRVIHMSSCLRRVTHVCS